MTGSAVGVRFDGDTIVGLHDAREGGPTTRVRVDERGAVDEAWSPDGARVLLEDREPDGSLFLRVEQGPRGYRLDAPDYGLQVIAADGSTLAATPEAQRWTGRRMLAGLTLPLVALLSGYEVLHAGAVVVDGGAVAVMASSGTGKSSTLANLVAAGAGFLADDVLALEVRDGEAVAHPGPRLMNLSTEVAAALPAGALDGWPVLAREEEVHLEPRGPLDAVPLRALVQLTRDGREPATRVARDDVGAPRLLGNTVLSYVQPPERLLRGLDVLQVVSRRVPVLHVAIGAGDGPARVAALVLEHVAAVTAS